MAKKVHENKPYKFITKDFNGESEVMILKGKGKILSIEERTASGTAQVLFQIFAPGEDAKPLKPEGAWFSLDNEALHNYLREAKQSQKDVAYRIEIKRRSNIDPKIPFMDLYQSMDDARENTIRILALADNVESSEAVTLPADDPTFGGGPEGRTISEMQAERATRPAPAVAGGSSSGGVGLNPDVALQQLDALVKAGGFSPSLIDSLGALAIASGATVEQVNGVLYSDGKGQRYQPATQPGRTFSIESPRWEEFNSDGRLNLGSAVVASGISMESAVSRNLLNQFSEKPSPADLKGFPEVVSYFTDLSYSICDYSQIKMYGQGSRISRQAESHTRVRGIFIDLLERFFYFPVEIQDGTIYITSASDVDEWVKKVGSTIVQRFSSAIQASQTNKGFGELRNELSNLPVLNREEGSQTQNSAPQQAPAPQGTTPTPPQDAVTEPSAPAPEPAPAIPQEAPVAPPQRQSQPPAPPAQEEAQPKQEETPAEPQSSNVSPLETSQTEHFGGDRASEANAVINNFVPTEGIYTSDEPATKGAMIPAEEEVDGDYEFVTPNVIRLNAEGYSGELASAEDVETFKSLLDELGFNLDDTNERQLIGKIIKFTFGNSFSKLQEIPSDLISQFIDWYASAGAEAINELRDLASKAF